MSFFRATLVAAASKGGASENALPRGLVAPGDPDGRVRPGRFVPAAVIERPGRAECLHRQVPRHDLLQRGESSRVPGLGRPAPQGGAQLFPGALHADRGQARGDQDQRGQVFRVRSRVQRRQDSAS